MAGILTRKTSQVLNYLEEKPTVYRLQQVTLPQIKSEQLVDEISQSCGVNATQTQAVLTALENRLAHYLDIGHGVKVGKFGSFKPVIRTKVSATKENLSMDNVRMKVIQFFPGSLLRNVIKNISIEGADTLDNVK